jgi:hypothetical protein
VKFFIAKNPEGNSIYEEHRDAEGVFVETKGITLTRFLQENKLSAIDLLKVDIEGAEVDLIKSLTDEELMNIKQITLECHDFIKELKIENEVKLLKQRLIRLGFGCIVFQYPNKDILFVNRNTPVVRTLHYYTHKGRAKMKMYKRHLSVFVRSTWKKISRLHA